jgi:Domain of unknown function (DUF2760)
MLRIALAFRAFFRVLFHGAAEELARSSKGEAAPAAEKPSAPSPAPKPVRATPTRPEPARNPALNLLAAMQREARWVDFIKEPISGYSDAQVGAAVRDIHRDCGTLIERIFGLKPIESAAEGSDIQVAEGFDPARIRLTGNVTDKLPATGKLCHHGWEATRCDLPEWTGSQRAIHVVAPAEIEVR